MEEDEDVLPNITPCLFGRDVSLHQDIVHSGLAAISMKRPKKHSRETSNLTNRNTFWNLHHPDLEQLNFKPTVSKDEIEEFFHTHCRHGSHCTLLHGKKKIPSKKKDDELKVILPPDRDSRYDEDPLIEKPSTLTFPLSDTDLEEERIIHRSPAVFCVTIGQISPINPMSLRGIPENVHQNKQRSHPKLTKPSTSKRSQKDSKTKSQIPTSESSVESEQIIHGKTGKLATSDNNVTDKSENDSETDSETDSDYSSSSNFNSQLPHSVSTVSDVDKSPSISAVNYVDISTSRPLTSPKSLIDLIGKSQSFAFVGPLEHNKNDENAAQQDVYELVSDTHSGDLITILEPREEHRDSDPQPFATNFPQMQTGPKRGRLKLLERPRLD